MIFQQFFTRMKKRIIRIILFPLVLFVFYVLFIHHIAIRCPFYEITKLYCPGCGLSRCLVSLLHLDFYQAFRYNPLLFILLPFFVPYTFYLYIIYVFEMEDQITKKVPNQFWNILLFFVILFGILRNIPLFSFLAPTIIH